MSANGLANGMNNESMGGYANGYANGHANGALNGEKSNGCAMGDKCCKKTGNGCSDSFDEPSSLYNTDSFTPWDPSQEPIFPPELKVRREISKLGNPHYMSVMWLPTYFLSRGLPKKKVFSKSQNRALFSFAGRLISVLCFIIITFLFFSIAMVYIYNQNFAKKKRKKKDLQTNNSINNVVLYVSVTN